MVEGNVAVGIVLETSFMELQNNSTLWGLFANLGYITIIEQIDVNYMKVRVPNDEVLSEFQKIIVRQANIQDDDLKEMLNHLIHGEIMIFSNLSENSSLLHQLL